MRLPKRALVLGITIATTLTVLAAPLAASAVTCSSTQQLNASCDTSVGLTSTPIHTAASAPMVVMPTSTTGTASSDGAVGDSMYMHQWTPTGAYAATQPNGMPYCTEAEHDGFYVVGPDGLRYPTWHPPVMTRADGTQCTFGHEHGDDPRSTAEWTIAQRHYAHQLPDGSLDLAHAGIPFGYMNQQMDNWEAATGANMPMRHEDHVGHKVATGQNLGVGLNKVDGTQQFFYPGVTCNYIIEYHQGVYSKDAFENNLHEILFNGDCSDGHGVHLDTMGEFGKVGQLTRSCDSAGDRSTIINTGTDYASASFPGDPTGFRLIVDRSCVETGLLVRQGQFSQAPYEAWVTDIGITKPGGAPVVDGLDLTFDVEDSIRYYWPGHASDGITVDNLGHFQDLCTENAIGLAFRGGACDAGSRTAEWNDPRAGFRGLNRGVYFKPGQTHNAGGSQLWYTDPFGQQAATSPFPGSILQQVSLDSTSYGPNANADETGTVLNVNHSDGGQTVHAPN